MRILPSAILLLAATSLASTAAPSYWMYVGTYTGKGSQGIYVYKFDPATGKLGEGTLAAETANPTFLAVHPSGKYLYAVNEVGKGTVSAFSVDAATGKLTPLNTAESGGNGPCHLTVDKSGREIITANYGSGSVGMVTVNPDGSLGKLVFADQHKGTGPNKGRQEGPHAHSANITPDGKFAVVADLGTDELVVYRFDAAKGSLTRDDSLTVKTAPGAGPRHFTFHPSGKYAFAINEINSTLTVYSYDGNGHLKELSSVSTLPQDFHRENTTAEVVAHPDGKTVYASNRGQDSIAVFSFDPATGKAAVIERTPTQGKTPRNFALDPTGKFLLAANQDTNNLVVFKVGADGKLAPAGQSVSVGRPVCIRFIQAK